MVRKLLVVLLLVLTSPMQAQVLKAWCQDITAVVGKSANITCTFSETVSCKERPFLVLKVPLDSKDFPDDVVDCTNGHCTVSNGYNYREQAGTQQVIEIPSVEKRLEGRYQCQYDTREPQDAKSCTLLVQEANLETGGETQENNVLVTTANEEQHTLLASDTRTANCQEHFRTKEESSVDGFPDNECSIPARPPAYSAGIAKTPLKPQDACAVNIHGKDGSCVDRSRSTGYEQDAEPLASDTPTDNYQDNSPNEEKTSVDRSPDANRPNPTTTPAFSTGIAKTPLKPQDACAVNIHGKDGSCVDRSRSTGCEQDAEPLASDTPTDNYQDNSPNEEKTSVDGLPNAKRQDPATTPAFSTGIAENPQHKVDIATDEDPSRNSACVSSPVAVSPKPE
ncbi:hypothetical protein BaRGS_00030753 [Batillaria attramentaria]|uniref:Immunoglobulin domain-containing protein n=1 Tax=Batillaria attramentaria TaxID=370345 RepID=A0ABD0JSC1_9CAEN